MIVSSADIDSVSEGDSTLAYTLIGAAALIIVGIGAYMVKTGSGRRDDDYYEDEDFEYDDDEDYEYDEDGYDDEEQDD